MPPGEAYGSQGQQQSQQLHAALQPIHQLHHHQQLEQQQPLQTGPQAAPPHPHFLNPYPNGNAQYQHQQHAQYNVHSAYPPQPAQFYHSGTPQYTNYNAGFQNHQPALAPAPVLAPAPPPASLFVDPSYLQNPSAPRPAGNILPASQPVTAVSPQVPHAMQPQSQSHSQPRLHQLAPAMGSPRLDVRRPPTHGLPVKQPTKEARRPSSSAGIAKSTAVPQVSPHLETLPLLLCVAEDCFSKAYAASTRVARSMSESEVAEHHKLIATGLGCLDVALQSNKLWPRLEARLCLRYASVLIEETTNIMEAETTLTRGIAVCEKHRFIDLKYSSQFLLIRTLFQRSQKAAFKSIESHIADCTTYKHVHWIYAFRFLKVAFHVQSGTAAEHQAIENLRKIAGIANQCGDKAIFVMAMLLEGLAHLSTMKDDWATRVQMCIAQASKLQLDESTHSPQTDVLLLLLDLACSLHQKTHHISAQKLSALQKRLEELKNSQDWASHHGEILLPIKRLHNASQTISNDTRAILRPGDDGVDYLVLQALGKQEAFALAFVFNGIVAHYKSSTPGRSSTMWGEALRLLEDTSTSFKCLPEALAQAEWTRGLACYAHILTGLQASTLCDWAKVKACLEKAQECQDGSETLNVLIIYLEGVFHQGTAQLGEALEIWKDKTFEMDWSGAPKRAGSHIETELSILAALNRLWIMQDLQRRDDAETAELVDLLRPICDDNPDQEIRTVYNLAMAALEVNPPLSMNQVKRHIQQALNGAQQASNTQYLSIALNVMRRRLFEDVVGEQALKSARAGSAQAKRSGNVLWMSVADGMLAQSLEVQGALEEARKTRENGRRLANEAYARTRV